jgi:hypothetical protein
LGWAIASRGKTIDLNFKDPRMMEGAIDFWINELKKNPTLE